MSGISVAPLSAEQIDAAYPLVREVAPSLGRTAWRRYARRAIGGGAASGRGIMVARRAGRAFPCGLFCYQKERDLSRGDVLVASHFIALDILDARPVLSALVGELEAMAPRLGCTAVRVAVAEDASDVAQILAGAGHCRESQVLAKTASVRGARTPRTNSD
ncbi:MAG: hypothetical protein KGL52_05830 [Rhodospirillales bacterium]|nr:hypothetical protein [Rhodospirillales bacterium]